MRIGVVGTELGPLTERTGALERVVLRWAAAAERLGVGVTRLESASAEELGRLAPRDLDAVVLNNRPLWARYVRVPVVHVLHNYPDAWGRGTADAERVHKVLQRGRVGAVSRALARHVETTYQLERTVRVVAPEVEQCFFAESWHGRGGPVVFPNRLLEKKGVRLFADIAAALTAEGHRCVAFAHLAPFSSPTAEQRRLLAHLAARGHVEILDPPATRADMAVWLSQAGLALCPSQAPEGLGLAALEAQAVGTPLVTSGRGGLAEATYPPNEVVASDDPAEWVEAAVRAMRRSGSLLPSAAVSARHSATPAVRSFLALLAEILERGEQADAGS